MSKRRTLKPRCPTCGRSIAIRKPTPAETLLTRLFREAYRCMAFGSPWPWVPGSFACEPAVLTSGVSDAIDDTAWTQTELSTCAPKYRRRAEPRDAITGCDDANPCALHRGRIAA